MHSPSALPQRKVFLALVVVVRLGSDLFWILNIQCLVCSSYLTNICWVNKWMHELINDNNNQDSREGQFPKCISSTLCAFFLEGNEHGLWCWAFFWTCSDPQKVIYHERYSAEVSLILTLVYLIWPPRDTSFLFWMLERQKDRELPSAGSLFQVSTVSRAGSGQSREPGAQRISPRWVAGIQLPTWAITVESQHLHWWEGSWDLNVGAPVWSAGVLTRDCTLESDAHPRTCHVEVWVFSQCSTPLLRNAVGSRAQHLTCVLCFLYCGLGVVDNPERKRKALSFQPQH